MTKAQMKAGPRAAPPFSGRDLLDGVYGIMGQPSSATVKGPLKITRSDGTVELVENPSLAAATAMAIGMKVVPCVCGAAIYLVDERIVPRCAQCRSEVYDGTILLTDEDLGPEGMIAVLPGKKGRVRRYEFFAGHWFELDALQCRLPNPVEKPALLDKLNRKLPARKKAPAAAVEHPARPFTRFVRLASGRVAEYSAITEPDCNCANQEMHDSYNLSGMTGVCPRHGLLCITCGENH